MALYAYTALAKDDAFVKGQIKASSVGKATKQLEHEGLLVVNIKLDKHKRYSKINNSITRISRLDRIFFTRYLHTLLESGVALNEALHITYEQSANVKFKEILRLVHHDVESGQM